MQKLLERNLGNGFADFPGLSLTGKLPIREELINEMIAEFLRSDAAPSDPVKTSEDRPDLRGLMKLIRSATIHADAGVVTLQFDIRA